MYLVMGYTQKVWLKSVLLTYRALKYSNIQASITICYYTSVVLKFEKLT